MSKINKGNFDGAYPGVPPVIFVITIIMIIQPTRKARRLAQRAKRPFEPAGVLRRRLLHPNGNLWTSEHCLPNTHKCIAGCLQTPRSGYHGQEKHRMFFNLGVVEAFEPYHKCFLSYVWHRGCGCGYGCGEGSCHCGCGGGGSCCLHISCCCCGRSCGCSGSQGVSHPLKWNKAVAVKQIWTDNFV